LRDLRPGNMINWTFMPMSTPPSSFDSRGTKSLLSLYLRRMMFARCYHAPCSILNAGGHGLGFRFLVMAQLHSH
jgi:hypothetical protein